MDQLLIKYAEDCHIEMIDFLLFFNDYEFTVLLKAYDITYCRGIKLKPRIYSAKISMNLIELGKKSLSCASIIYEKIEYHLINRKNIQKLARVLCKTDYDSFYQFSLKYKIDFNRRFSSKNLFHIACIHGNIKIMKFMINHVNINKQTLYKGKYHQTALHLAVEHHHIDIIKLLLHYNCNSSIYDYNDKPVLYYVSPGMTGNQLIFELLVSLGVNINIKYNNKTLLYSAVKDYELETVKYLLKLGASPYMPCLYKNEKSRYIYCYETPLDLAKKQQDEEMIEILKNNKKPIISNYIY